MSSGSTLPTCGRSQRRGRAKTNGFFRGILASIKRRTTLFALETTRGVRFRFRSVRWFWLIDAELTGPTYLDETRKRPNSRRNCPTRLWSTTKCGLHKKFPARRKVRAYPPEPLFYTSDSVPSEPKFCFFSHAPRGSSELCTAKFQCLTEVVNKIATPGAFESSESIGRRELTGIATVHFAGAAFSFSTVNSAHNFFTLLGSVLNR